MVVLVRYLKEPLRTAAKALKPAADKTADHPLKGQGPAAAKEIASLIRSMVEAGYATLSRQFTAFSFA